MRTVSWKTEEYFLENIADVALVPPGTVNNDGQLFQEEPEEPAQQIDEELQSHTNSGKNSFYTVCRILTFPCRTVSIREFAQQIRW